MKKIIVTEEQFKKVTEDTDKKEKHCKSCGKELTGEYDAVSKKTDKGTVWSYFCHKCFEKKYNKK